MFSRGVFQSFKLIVQLHLLHPPNKSLVLYCSKQGYSLIYRVTWNQLISDEGGKEGEVKVMGQKHINLNKKKLNRVSKIIILTFKDDKNYRYIHYKKWALYNMHKVAAPSCFNQELCQTDSMLSNNAK